MTISERQKNIVNPFASGYEYTNQRERWIQTGIHDSYINYGVFPEIGPLSGPVPFDSALIDAADLQAYAMMYPQNAKWIPRQSRLAYVSDDDAHEALTNIAKQLRRLGKVQFYVSPTSEESYLPKNQQNIDGNSDEEDEVLNQIVSQLIAIPHSIKGDRLDKIRRSLGLNPLPTSQPPVESILQASKFPARQESDSIDLYNWKNK